MAGTDGVLRSAEEGEKQKGQPPWVSWGWEVWTHPKRNEKKPFGVFTQRMT